MLKLSRTGKSKYDVQKNILLDEQELSFYLLGVYFTDGHINDKKHHLCFGLSSKDEGWLISIRDILCKEKPIYKNKNYYSLELSDIDCMNWLIEWGCTPRKSKTIILKKEIPDKYKKDFFRGVIDGDGCITQSKYSKTKNGKVYNYNKKTIYICSGSKDFVNQLKLFVPDDINCNIQEIHTKETKIQGRKIKPSIIYRLIFNDSNAEKIGSYCYYENHQLSLPRKFDIVASWSTG